MLMLALLVPAQAGPDLAAPPTDTPELPEVVQDCEVERERCEVDAASEGMDVVVEVEGMLTEDGPLGGAELRLELPSDAWFATTTRLRDGAWLGRVEGGVDVLGGGRAHLRLGALAGLDNAGGSGTGAQVGGLLSIGWTGDVLSLDGRLRTVFSGHKLDTFTLEQEVQLGVRVVGPVGVTATWLRTGTGSNAVDGGGIGLSVRF